MKSDMAHTSAIPDFHCPAYHLQLAIMDVAGNVLASNSRLIQVVG